MAKRLTDTEKWKDDWYLSLSNDYRIIWQYLIDNCDHAGVLKKNIRHLNFCCNTNITEQDLKAIFNGRLIDNEDYYFIPKFLKFQYDNLNSDRPVIVSVRKQLENKGLSSYVNKSFGNDYLIIKSKSKDKSKSKSKSIKGIVKGKKGCKLCKGVGFLVAQHDGHRNPCSCIV